MQKKIRRNVHPAVKFLKGVGITPTTVPFTYLPAGWIVNIAGANDEVEQVGVKYSDKGLQLVDASVVRDDLRRYKEK